MKWVVAWEDKTGHLKPECKRHGHLKKKKKMMLTSWSKCDGGPLKMIWKLQLEE